MFITQYENYSDIKKETNYNNLMLDPEKSWLYTIYEHIEVEITAYTNDMTYNQDSYLFSKYSHLPILIF